MTDKKYLDPFYYDDKEEEEIKEYSPFTNVTSYRIRRSFKGADLFCLVVNCEKDNVKTTYEIDNLIDFSLKFTTSAINNTLELKEL